VARCADLNRQITGLESELRILVRQLAPSLLAVPGCGVLSAAVLVGETAGVDRFKWRCQVVCVNTSMEVSIDDGCCGIRTWGVGGAWAGV
jgi:transposase